MIPVVHLILHFGHARLPRTVPDSLGVEIRPGEEQVADQSVVNLANGLDVALRVPQVMADRDIKALLLGVGVGRLHEPIAGCVHGDRLFQENVLSRVHRRRELRGAETRWSAEQNDVRPRRDGFFIGVKTDEAAARRHIHLVVKLVVKVLMRALDRLGKRIGHGDQPDVAVRLIPERIERSARASSPATDERDLDLVAAGGKSGVAKLERADRGRRRACHKLSA